MTGSYPAESGAELWCLQHDIRCRSAEEAQIYFTKLKARRVRLDAEQLRNYQLAQSVQGALHVAVSALDFCVPDLNLKQTCLVGILALLQLE